MIDPSKEIINHIYVDAVAALAQGKSRQQVTHELIQRGVAPPLAEQLVGEANRARKSAVRQQGIRTFAAGIGLLIFGALITGVTYSLAKPGGVFLVSTGLFIVGAVNLLRGLFRMVVG